MHLLKHGMQPHAASDCKRIHDVWWHILLFPVCEWHAQLVTHSHVQQVHAMRALWSEHQLAVCDAVMLSCLSLSPSAWQLCPWQP